MNTDERPPFSKGENSKQPGNRREIKRSPPARRIGEGRALLPHLDSISFMTCRAAANSAEAPPAAGTSPVPAPRALLSTPSPRRSIGPGSTLHLTRAPSKHIRINSSVCTAAGASAWQGSHPTAWPRGRLQKSGSIGPAVQGGLGSTAGAAAAFRNLPDAPAEPRHWGAVPARRVTLVRGAVGTR